MRKARVVSSLAASSPSPQHTHTRTARKTFTTFAANTEAKLSSRSLTLFVSRSVAVLGLRLSCERPLASQHSNLRIQRYDQTRHKLRVGSFRFNGFNSQFNELRRHYSLQSYRQSYPNFASPRHTHCLAGPGRALNLSPPPRTACEGAISSPNSSRRRSGCAGRLAFVTVRGARVVPSQCAWSFGSRWSCCGAKLAPSSSN